ncbi:SGNH/GDSL hydrolase family protein [Streptomyces cavernicola]|uniref:SGNH/GDSL hydrolase family protein n=1 Tax=Streptomyces cavernicola TaxID=3043613 RepID=A0ABT6SA61_9ACTN|nr:SGNH/GDSL hydrolase family protein [Streptomyces sp. B-S-A6]MDI3405078.1 SGNH/GDSL hydrolase family protein [Streptomyces sp. B-S-A6]
MAQQGLNRKQVLGLAALGAGALAFRPGLGVAAAAAPVASAAPVTRAGPRTENGVAWWDVAEWGVEGKGWSDTARFYDRLPARAEQTVRPVVWELSRNAAGMQVRFATDSPSVHARYVLRSSRLALPHMPATGVSGIDLYAQDAAGRLRWAGVTKPASTSVTERLLNGADPGMRQYTAYLPLYNGVESLEIGVEAGAAFRPVAPRTRRPVVFYGSSIAQGACASRPGMAFPAVLGRRLDVPTVNLGFSGNAFMEPEVGDLLAELDPSVYVVDCLPNMTPDLVAERAEPLIRRLREARPDTPIVMVEDRTYANAWLVGALRARHEGSRAAYREAYRRLRTSGVKGLSYLEGEGLLGDDDEATTDGSHPSDLGMARYADAYTQVLRRLL